MVLGGCARPGIIGIEPKILAYKANSISSSPSQKQLHKSTKGNLTKATIAEPARRKLPHNEYMPWPFLFVRIKVSHVFTSE
jgi:hypothetical protein